MRLALYLLSDSPVPSRSTLLNPQSSVEWGQGVWGHPTQHPLFGLLAEVDQVPASPWRLCRGGSFWNLCVLDLAAATPSQLGAMSTFSVGAAGFSSLLTSVPFQEDRALSGQVVWEDIWRGRSWYGQGRAFTSLFLLPPSDLLGAFCVSLRSFCPPAVGIRAGHLASRLCIKSFMCVAKNYEYAKATEPCFDSFPHFSPPH